MANKKSLSPTIAEDGLLPEAPDSKAFHDFVTEEMKGLYWYGQQQAKWYARLQKAVQHPSFIKLLEEQAIAVNPQAEKIEQVFELLGEKAKGKKSPAFETVIEESTRLMAEMKKRSLLRDTLILLILQKAVLLQLASCDVAILASGKTGNEEIIHLLEENRKASMASTDQLAALAEELKTVNEAAASSPAGKKADSPEVAAVYDSINLTGKTTPQ